MQASGVFVSSAEFRDLAGRREAGKVERLFRAAISAFACLTRPTRRELAQLDDLALPLFDCVSPAARRFAAAALSECAATPPGLTRRLAGEPVEISAPLIVRSPALTDVDLIALIGRHGLPHARVIARRKDLNPVIGRLLDALKDPEIRRLRGGLALVASNEPATAEEESASEHTRRELRAMMRPATAPATPSPVVSAPLPSDCFGKLRDTALSGHLPLFRTALADALGMTYDEACAILAGPGYARLLPALRRLGLSEERAFLVAAALFPEEVSGAEAIRLFLYRYARTEAASAPPAAPVRLVRKAS